MPPKIAKYQKITDGTPTATSPTNFVAESLAPSLVLPIGSNNAQQLALWNACLPMIRMDLKWMQVPTRQVLAKPRSECDVLAVL